jgi:hypothetical protein
MMLFPGKWACPVSGSSCATGVPGCLQYEVIQLRSEFSLYNVVPVFHGGIHDPFNDQDEGERNSRQP